MECASNIVYKWERAQSFSNVPSSYNFSICFVVLYLKVILASFIEPTAHRQREQGRTAAAPLFTTLQPTPAPAPAPS